MLQILNLVQAYTLLNRNATAVLWPTSAIFVEFRKPCMSEHNKTAKPRTCLLYILKLSTGMLVLMLVYDILACI